MGADRQGKARLRSFGSASAEIERSAARRCGKPVKVLEGMTIHLRLPPDPRRTRDKDRTSQSNLG
jgi:hypothetical protein